MSRTIRQQPQQQQGYSDRLKQRLAQHATAARLCQACQSAVAVCTAANGSIRLCRDCAAEIVSSAPPPPPPPQQRQRQPHGAASFGAVISGLMLFC